MNIFITGCESGIGQSLTKRILKDGHSVFACHFKDIPEKETTLLKNKYQDKIHFIQLDVTQRGAVEQAVLNALEVMSSIDVLINVAGIAYFSSPLTTTDLEWKNTFDVNVNGYFYLTRSLLPVLINSPSAQIINMSSVWGTRGNKDMYAYSVSKYAVQGMTDGLREYCKPLGIKVTSIILDKVDTSFRELMDDHINISREQKKRMLAASDVADTVSYLLKTSKNALASSIVLDAVLWR
ncbi:SDR family oxidoreductase [Yersinia sp. 1652 StPb PI]|uniref:SDR family oxidoreductase n=2 Tax=Yersinia TaxID=629 RepID=UPI00355B9446